MIIDVVGIEVTWDGGTYRAAVAAPRVELDLQTGGFMPEADLRVKLRKATLPRVSRGDTFARVASPPAPRHACTSRPWRRRVTGVTVSDY